MMINWHSLAIAGIRVAQLLIVLGGLALLAGVSILVYDNLRDRIDGRGRWYEYHD